MASNMSSADPATNALSVPAEYEFSNFPVELFRRIFSHLEIPDLKACAEVSYPWYCALRQAKSLSSKTIRTWDAESMNFWAFIGLIFELRIKNIRVNQEIRLLNFGVMDLKLLRFFLPSEFFKKTITHLEIVKHEYILFDSLCHFISKFENLAHLSLAGIRENPSIAFFNIAPRQVNPKITIDPFLTLENLKSLSIQTSTTYFQPLVSILGPFCQNLQSLHFELDYLPISTIGAESSAVEEFVKIMHNNVTTLREITLDSFHVTSGYARKNYYLQDYRHELVRAETERDFLKFIVHLTQIQDWGQPGLFLSKIHFRFPVIRVEAEGLRGHFLEFLRTTTRLKHLCLSQVFLVPENSSLRELVDSVPIDCYLSIEGVASVIGTFDNPVIHHFANHGFFAIVVGPEEADSDDDDEDSDEDDDNNAEPDPVDGNDDEDEANIQLIVPMSPLDPALTNILIHSDSQVNLRTETINLTLTFVCCRSIENISFLNDYIRVLTKIKIDQAGVALPAKIVIGDVDIQRIIVANSKILTELCFTFCNLATMTDYGLTGIGPDACRRMALTNDFQIKDGDRIGLPISSLNGLISFSVSDVGDQVTDISAYHAFIGSKSMRYLRILSPMITESGLKKLRDIFGPNNQTIKIDIPTKS